MRCPKCHYLSFDPEPRCKNCGYDLEVADADLALHTADAGDDVEVPDLTLHERPNAAAAPVTLELVHAGGGARAAVAEPKKHRAKRNVPASRFTVVDEPIDDVYEEPARQLEPEAFEPDPIEHESIEPESTEHDLNDRNLEPEAPAPMAPPEPVPPPPAAPPLAMTLVPDPEPVLARAPFRAPDTTTDMPLFVKGMAESDLRAEAMSLTPEVDEHVPAVPPTRPPLVVRRTTVEPQRTQPKPERRLGPLDHDLLEDLKRVEREEALRQRELARSTATEPIAEGEEPVEPGRRLAAAGIDVAVLGGIAAFVFWATLRLCNVPMSAVGWAALIPFVIFIAVMDVSYLLMFTAAGGQTPGKMLMHLRVVGDDRPADAPVPLGRAAWRSALTLISVVALGIGWLPVLFGRGLTLHDRLAHTRVVRV